ncbi:acyltransferase family protein [Hansschlegelia beijingensis]
MWPLMVVLTAALASRAAQPKPGLLRGRALAWLGELSYAIYMTHAIVLQVTFTGAKLLGIGHTLPQRAALGFAALIATAVVAQAAYSLVEKPGRGLMARLLSQPRPARAFTAAADRSGAGR